jgi:hypothetical protein
MAEGTGADAAGDAGAADPPKGGGVVPGVAATTGPGDVPEDWQPASTIAAKVKRHGRGRRVNLRMGRNPFVNTARKMTNCAVKRQMPQRATGRATSKIS